MKKKVLPAVLGLCLLLVFLAPVRAQAKETEEREPEEWKEGEAGEEALSELDFKELDRILEDYAGERVSMKELAVLLMQGNWKEALKGVLDGLWTLFFSELSQGKKTAARILLLSAVSALFVNITASFQSRQVSETGFYVSYMLMAVLLFSGVSTALQIAETAMEYLFSFMAALLPVFFVAVASAGGSATAMGFYQLTFFFLTVFEWCFLYVFLPVLKLYVTLVLLNSLTKEDMLSGLTSLLETVFSWGLKTITGLVLGLNVIQGMTLPFADSLKNSGLRKVISALPGLGNSAEAVLSVVAGSGNLIKNGVGMAAVAAIAMVCLFPLCKLMLLCVLYQAAGAFSQPVADKRLVAGIAGTAKGMGMAARLLLSAMLLFILTIAMICAFTNTAYFAG